MTTMLDQNACVDAGQSPGDGLLPVTPYTALQYHFGMLLGVDDLETAQSYPRGKMRLHNAWLHGEGVVWGFGVAFNKDNEIRVTAGLALDASGHELHLDTPACLDVGKWYGQHKGDQGFTTTDAGTGKKFTAYVVAKFKPCLTRPVPSIAEPCAGSVSDVAFSRVFETVDLFLRPGTPPIQDRGYHRLRVLFELEPDSGPYADIKQRRDTIHALPADQQPAAYLDAFREFAARDEIDRLPQHSANGDITSIFPEDPAEVVLAQIKDIVVLPNGTDWVIQTPVPAVDTAVRPTLVPTTTIQELLCGPAGVAAAGGGGGGGAPAPADAGGPRFDRASIAIAGQTITLRTMAASVALAPASVDVRAFRITMFTDADGWTTMDVRDATVDAAGTTVSLALRETPAAGARVRIQARGTGPLPILGTNHVPLAGAANDPPGSTHDGHDFVHMMIGS